MTDFSFAPPPLVVVSSLAMRTWTTSTASSYLQDRFPVPGNAYAPLCPRSSPLRPSLPTEYGPTLPRGIRTMPPISYSMTRACTFESQLPCTLSRPFIHSIQMLPSNLITAQYEKIKKDSISTRDTGRFSLTFLSKRCPCGTGRTTR